MVKADNQAQPEEIQQRVLSYIQKNDLLAGQSRLIVAVSGGPDSVCLLHVLYTLQNKLGVKLHIAHLDHQLRGAESEGDAHYVADLTRQLGLSASIEKRDVKAYQKERRLSLEEAAREVRYTFLAEVARSIGAERVAVGHTRDDHVETILMHLVRGTGTRGLRGLLPLNQWRQGANSVAIIRPLLDVSREETAAYCAHFKLSPRLDASNLSLSPLRNRIRQQLIPLLQGYNPATTEALLRTARTAADDLAFLEEEVARRWENIAAREGNNIILDKARFRELPASLQRHTLRRAIETLLGNLKDIETRHIEEILEALPKPAGKVITLPEGLLFAIEYDRYILGADPASLSPFPELETESPLKIPGETKLDSWRVSASVVNGGQKGADRFTVCFDLDKTGTALAVRTRRRGDRFQPLGMAQSKRLSEFMIDAHIPQAWRDHIPLVVSGTKVLWMVGYRLAETVKVTSDTKSVLCLKFERK